MLNLQTIKRLTIVGGGTAGWFSALVMRHLISSPAVEIMVIEAPSIGIIGVGEGGLLNLVYYLKILGIPVEEFAKETGAAWKLGFAYEGWNTGQDDDCYYHMFYTNKTEEMKSSYAFLPCFSSMIGKRIPLHSYIKGFHVIAQQGSQEAAREMMKDDQNGIAGSYHFDSYRIAQYLQKVAVGRGVVHRQAKVVDFEMDEKRHVKTIKTENELVATDFLIDASGFARLAIGKKLQSKWNSFRDHLLLDSAIPFHMPHPKKEPYLVTRAIAMNAGWMWQIPLIERVGAGYVFSSKHIDVDTAVKEIEQKIGHTINPMRTISFEPGHFDEVWQGNVLAIGLASGFVEPLEATSIGQMLDQVFNFARVLMASSALVSQRAIDEFNVGNTHYWMGIRDFLRLHYDCPRRDTGFWRDVAQLPFPRSYEQIKECFAHRTPRTLDIQGYASHGWPQMFGALSWMMVGDGLGLIAPEGAARELLSMSPADQESLTKYWRNRKL